MIKRLVSALLTIALSSPALSSIAYAATTQIVAVTLQDPSDDPSNSGMVIKADTTKVKAGRVIEIPAQDDGPPYFTLKRSKSSQVAEVLSVLVTPTPLEGIEITDKAQKLPGAQVASWEKQWNTQVGWLEMENGAGL